MSDMGDLIAAGLLGQPNASGLTANQAHEIGERVASRVAPLDAAWAEAEAALREGWYLGVQHSNNDDHGAYMAIAADMVWLTESLSDEWYAYGPTPAAALRDLASKLRERAG